MTEIHRIQEKVEYAKNRFSQYLNSLVGLGAQKATTQEIELFNLDEAYQDGVLRRSELGHLRQSFGAIDFDQLVADRKIIYNSTAKKLEYRVNTYDFNRDGVINQTDKDAVNHVINFFNNNVNTLTDMLALAGNKDEIARFNIQKWAIARGMEEGTEEHDAFVNKFYDQLYINPEIKAPMELLGKVLNLYDMGLGKENLDEINDYVLMLKENQPVRLLADFYRFTNSDAFNVPDNQKQEMKDKFISALLNTSPKNGNIPALKERQKLVADSISRRKISILGGSLTATALSDFIDRTATKDDIAKMRIENIAKQLGLENLQSSTNDEFDLFVNKFYNEFYISSKEGLNMSDVTYLARYYSKLKFIKGADFKLSDLDVYNYALNNNEGSKFYTGDLNLLFALDRNAEKYEMTDPIREATMRNYIDIITGKDASDKRVKDHLKLALRTGVIPLTKEPVTITKLNEFLTIAADDASYLDLVITKMANNRDIFDNPANPNDEFDQFKANFTNFSKQFSKSAQMSNLNFLANLYDGNDIGFNELSILSTALKNKATKRDIARLTEKYKTDVFNVVDKTEKLREYAEILSGPDKEKKNFVSAFLRSGRIPLNPTEKEDVTLRELDTTLVKISEEGGLLELRINQLARKSGINESESPAEFNNFTTTMTSWHNDKNVSFQELNMLAGFYRNTNKDLQDLSLYADAIQQGVKAKEVSVLFSFEESDAFDLIGAGRDQKIQSYLDILAKPAESVADRERKNILIQSIRGNRVYLLNKELSVDSLDEVLSKTQTEDEIFDLQSDLWAERLEYPVGSSKYNGFKSSVLALKKDENLNSTSISRTLAYLKEYPDLTFQDFGIVAQAVSRSRRNSPTIRNIIRFIQGEDFANTTTSTAYKTEKLNQYLAILDSGSNLEKQVLKSAVKSGKVYITDKEISATNLEQALNIAKSEDDYTDHEVKKLAKSLGYEVGTSQYNNFKRKFYDELYVEKKMSLSDLRYLASFYSRGVFSDDVFNQVVEARKQNISTKALRNLEKFANITDMPQEDISSYLNVMLGEQGSAKKQFLTQVFVSNFIPIANARLF